jgi:hypothetical protein
MAKDKAKKLKREIPKTKAKQTLPFTSRNYTWFGIGILIIVIGYVALGMGSITLAPILLVLGYCVIIPISILIGEKKKKLEVEPKKGEIPPTETKSNPIDKG